MTRGKFFIFLFIIIGALVAIPKDLLEENIVSFNRIELPFSNKSPEELEAETYDAIYEAFTDLSDYIYVSKKLTSDQVFDIRDEVIANNPEIFYLDYEASKYWTNGKLEFKYKETKEKIEEKRKAVDARANFIINKIIKPGMSDLEKEMAIHDYIVLNTKYDAVNYDKDTIPESSYNVYGVLIDGVAVCEGYAKAFKMLLDKVGIESIVVSAPEINHAWNMVVLDGEYYHVDVTWDDPVPDRRGKVRYMFFNVSDRKMLQGEHRWNQAKYPKATSEKYSYMWGK